MKRLREKLGEAGKAAVKRTAGTPKQDHLSGDELALWRHVAGSIEPIKVKLHVPRRGGATSAEDAAEPPLRRPASRQASLREAAPVVTGPGASRGAKPAAPMPLADFDARKARKIARGHTEINARLDLHGLRQDEAHVRLLWFLRDCHGRGLKHVLVITGKGKETDDRTVPFGDTLDRPARGVLRRNVPRWLAEPEVRNLVVSYTSALPRHGGDGAFYIELRRAR